MKNRLETGNKEKNNRFRALRFAILTFSLMRSIVSCSTVLYIYSFFILTNCLAMQMRVECGGQRALLFITPGIDIILFVFSFRY